MAKKTTTKKKAETYFKIDLRPKLISISNKFDRLEDVNVRYPLLAPYAFAHIVWDPDKEELVYLLEEPPLDRIEKELLNLIEMGLSEMINVSYSGGEQTQEIIDYLEKNVQAIIIELGVKVTKKSYLKIMYYVYRNFVGLNKIEAILHDYFIEDIECNGFNHPIYIVHRKFDILRSNIIFRDEKKLSGFVEKLAQKSGRYVSYAKPLLDGTLPDGSRVNATYTRDVTTRGPTFTIRKFTKNPWTPIHLINYGTASPEFFAYLWLAIEHKFNVIVIGETSSGKTTLLNSFMYFIPPQARVCSIEDTREINLSHENWLPSVTRLGFGIPDVHGERMGEVNLFDLLKASFRQNPDYVIVGEIRGKEAFVLFQGMASGHPSFGTMHAGSVETMVQRLMTPPISLSGSLCESADIVISAAHIREKDKSFRRVIEVDEVRSVTSNGEVDKNPVFIWEPKDDRFIFNKDSHIFKRIERRTGISVGDLIDELNVRAELLRKMKSKHIVNFKDFTRVAHEYAKDPKSVLEKFGVEFEMTSSNEQNDAKKPTEKQSSKDDEISDLSKRMKALRKTINNVKV